jgi:pimeloyl-ACP methyl ester carboxylesterase
VTAELMTTGFAKVNGVSIAFRVQGEGPALVLVMGYRLSSAAWPAVFIEGLARRFRVITLDNRGTGQSDKPVDGYSIANMARDVAGVLDELKIARAHMLGYSMGGAIAQEFVRQFSDRVAGLVLCATNCGGPRAIYASPSVIRVMRELDGLKPEEVARQIWQVTYSPGYLEKHRELAEDQMRREIAAPTPLHGADLQFQAFAEFDCSATLPNVRSPTLVLTGDLDQLVSPQNSRIIASLIPGANLIIIPGCGHRLMWEATEECIAFVSEFLLEVDMGRLDCVAKPAVQDAQSVLASFADFMTPAVELFSKWPWMLAGAGVDAMTIARQSIYFGGKAQFGDGKNRRPDAATRHRSSVRAIGELAQGARLSPGHDRTSGEARRFDRKFDRRRRPAGRQEGGARRLGRRLAACVANRRGTSGLGV